MRIFFSFLTFVICGCPESLAEIVVVSGSDAEWVEQHAAREFARYASLLTGQQPALLKDRDPRLATATNAVLVGNPQTNVTIADLARDGTVNFDAIRDDGFIIQSVRTPEKTCLVLGGTTGRGTLYAVYHYLQKYCHIGFFLDGERIPEAGSIVFDGISDLENPRFRYRKQNRFGDGHRMIRKYTCHWWKWDDYKRVIDWWAKRKLNEGDLYFGDGGIGGLYRDEVVRELFADILTDADWQDGGSHIYDDWPREYRVEIEKNAYAYCMKLGFFVEPYVPPNVASWYEARHPEINFNDHTLQTKLARSFLSKIIRDFPAPHHIYGGLDQFWSTERAAVGGEGVAHMGSYIQTQTKAVEFLREFDPMAIHRSDFGWRLNLANWPKTGVRAFIDSFPGVVHYFDDYSADISSHPAYERYDYLKGQAWSFGTFWNAAMDTPHGDLHELLARTKKVAAEAPNCIGFRLHMENQGTNVLYRHFNTAVAWNPQRMSVDRFLDDYAVQRYGMRSVKTMRQSLDKLVGAMKANTIWDNPGLGGAYIPFYRYSLRPANSKYTELDNTVKSFELFREALRLALLEKENQRHNKLYENDVVDLARSCLGKLFDYHYVRLHATAAVEDWERFDRSAEIALECLNRTEKILSTRSDFSMQETIDYAKSVKGTKGPRTTVWEISLETLEEYAKGGSGEYANVDCYEQMHRLYRPAVKAEIKRLRGGEAPNFHELHRRWVKGPTAVESRWAFKGTTLEAVSHAYDYLESIDYEALLPGVNDTFDMLKTSWAPMIHVDRPSMPEASGEIILASPFGAGPGVSSRSISRVDDVDVFIAKAAVAFTATDWNVEYSARYSSGNHAPPAVWVRKADAEDMAGVYCQQDQIMFQKTHETNLYLHSEFALLPATTDKFHRYRIQKKGDTVEAFVDGQSCAAFQMPSAGDRWLLEVVGYEDEPMFIDWLRITK